MTETQNGNPVQFETLLNEREYARIRRCSVGTLRRERLSRRGCQFVKLGASIRYRLADIREFINRNVQLTEMAQ